MSADNGYVIQQKQNGKFTLQMYFASNDEYPNPENDQTEFDTVEEATETYRKGIENDGMSYWSEYGLSFNVPSLA